MKCFVFICFQVAFLMAFLSCKIMFEEIVREIALKRKKLNRDAALGAVGVLVAIYQYDGFAQSYDVRLLDQSVKTITENADLTEDDLLSLYRDIATKQNQINLCLSQWVKKAREEECLTILLLKLTRLIGKDTSGYSLRELSVLDTLSKIL